jgi:hypothetical protein
MRDRMGEGTDWIGPVLGREKWKAPVNAVMNLRVHKMLGNYRVAAQLVASRVVSKSIYRERERKRERAYSIYNSG